MRRALLLAAALGLGGCGFHPLYGSGASGGTNRNFQAIEVEPVSDLTVANTGYDLRNEMIDLLDAGQAPISYQLKMTFNVTTQGIALENNADITRYNDTLTVNYSLVDAATGKELTKGIETGLSAYNVVQSPYATLQGQQDADRRAAEDIAQRIRLDLGLYFSRHEAAAQ